MPKFRIHMSEKLIRIYYYEVEASSEDEAQEMCEELEAKDRKGTRVKSRGKNVDWIEEVKK